MNNVIKGSDIMVFVGSGAAAKSIAMATNHTLTISAETKETSSKDSGGKWATSEVGILSWEATSENILSTGAAGKGYDDLFELMIKRQPVELVMAIEGDSTSVEDDKLDAVPEEGWKPKTGDGYTGKAIITSLEKSAPNGDNATFSVTFTGVSELKKVTA